MKRRPLDRNARSLEADTQLRENIVNEALITRVVYQPAQNVAVRMRGDGIDVWRRVHTLLLSSDLDRRYRICRVPARRCQWSPLQLPVLWPPRSAVQLLQRIQQGRGRRRLVRPRRAPA